MLSLPGGHSDCSLHRAVLFALLVLMLNDNLSG